MGVMQKMLNMDEYYKTTTGDKIIANDLSVFSVNDMELIDNKLMTVYNNVDIISIKPSCDCGKVNGLFKVGILCNECSSTCREPFEKIQPVIWLKAIGEEYKFINPFFWLMISRLLGEQVDYLRYFSDTSYNPIEKVKIPDYIQYIKVNILKDVRTYPNLMANLTNILNYLLTNQKFKKPEKITEINLLLKMLQEQGPYAWSTYLPILNKRMFIKEKNNKGNFVLLVNTQSVNAVKTWVRVCSDLNNMSDRKKSNAMGIVMHSISTLFKEYFSKYLSRKSGIFRKNIYGARSHFTFRCVIVSITGKHKHDEVEAPWCVGVTAFRPHLINKLFKLGYNYKQASDMLFANVNSYNSILDKLLQELIAESKYPGIPIITHRNPSLLQGSAQLTYITKFKTDPKDMTCGMSVLICKSPNADFDGCLKLKYVV